MVTVAFLATVVVFAIAFYLYDRKRLCWVTSATLPSAAQA